MTYLMNPGEDRIVFGDELADGMWVLPESPVVRSTHHPIGDDPYAQEFRQVTRLMHNDSLITFIAEWFDGYQEVHTYADSHPWLVKKTFWEE